MKRTRRLPPIVLMLLGWFGLGIGIWTFCLLILQILFGRQLEMHQTALLGRDLSLNVRLTELALERYPPGLVSELTGLDLGVMVQPPKPSRVEASLQRQTIALQKALCKRLSHCPMLVPFQDRTSGRVVWIELISPLEPVWLRVGLSSSEGWPPEPSILGLAFVGAIVINGGLFLLFEVDRPLRGLERGLARVGEDNEPEALPAVGAPEVQRLTKRFNDMLIRLSANRQERTTMLAGIAHDLRAPITRLQFRLSLPSLNPQERERCASDLVALERITGQFLLFAGGGDGEDLVELPIDQWLAEVSASHSPDQLRLDLEPLVASLRPVALGRAVVNLIDNAFIYGVPPVTVRLRGLKHHFVIEVWDFGKGMPPDEWERALQPFQRLDASRCQQGHCGLGLAIVSHVVRRHGGDLRFLLTDNDNEPNQQPGLFAIRLELPYKPPLAGID